MSVFVLCNFALFWHQIEHQASQFLDTCKKNGIGNKKRNWKTLNVIKPIMIRLLVQVQLIFLQWMPWLLRMSRPGEKITRKSIQMQKKLKELDKKEMKSKSLLANVLEMEDDFHPASLPHSVHPSNTNKPALSNLCLTRYIYSISIYALFLLFKLIIAIKALFFSCIVCSFLFIFPLFF